MKYADNVINLLICFTIYGWWRPDQTTNHFCRLTANSCVFVCRSACMCLLRVVFVIVDRYLKSSYFKNSTLRFKHLFSFQIIVIHLKLILNKNAKKCMTVSILGPLSMCPMPRIYITMYVDLFVFLPQLRDHFCSYIIGFCHVVVVVCLRFCPAICPSVHRSVYLRVLNGPKTNWHFDNMFIFFFMFIEKVTDLKGCYLLENC